MPSQGHLCPALCCGLPGGEWAACCSVPWFPHLPHSYELEPCDTVILCGCPRRTPAEEAEAPAGAPAGHGHCSAQPGGSWQDVAWAAEPPAQHTVIATCSQTSLGPACGLCTFRRLQRGPQIGTLGSLWARGAQGRQRPPPHLATLRVTTVTEQANKRIKETASFLAWQPGHTGQRTWGFTCFRGCPGCQQGGSGWFQVSACLKPQGAAASCSVPTLKAEGLPLFADRTLPAGSLLHRHQLPETLGSGWSKGRADVLFMP